VQLVATTRLGGELQGHRARFDDRGGTIASPTLMSISAGPAATRCRTASSSFLVAEGERYRSVASRVAGRTQPGGGDEGWRPPLGNVAAPDRLANARDHNLRPESLGPSALPATSKRAP